MRHTDNLLKDIHDGLSGRNVGISTGLTKFDEVIAGIQRKSIYNIGAGMGAGKTSLALYSFIYVPLKTHLDDPHFKIIYFSLEISAETLLAKLLSLYIYETFNKEIPYKKLLSRTKNSQLTEKEFKMVLECKDWLNKVENKLYIYDRALTAKSFYAYMKSFAESFGTFEDVDEYNISYTPNDPDLFVLAILDHVSLVKTEGVQKVKEAIDTICSEAIHFRNKCFYSFVFLQQLNRTQSSMDRRKAELQEIELQDFKDTAGPSEAADVVLGLYFPHRDKISSYRKYNISKGFRDSFRSIIILKNRYGECDQIIPINFFGSIGLFKELDEPEKYQDIIDYSPYLYLFPVKASNMEFLKLDADNDNYFF